MYDGKKSLAQSSFYRAFKIIKEKIKKPPNDVFKEALKNVMPSFELKSRRIVFVIYQVPVEVKENRKFILAIRQIIAYARLRTERSIYD